MKNRADADDVSEGFSVNVLTRSWGLRVETDDGILAWLYVVLRSTLLDHFRKEG